VVSTLSPCKKRSSQATELEGNQAHPVHGCKWLTVADIVISVVLGCACRVKKRVFGKPAV
jgi:hypothetical protein